jgi:hypothetical protein
VEAERQKKTHQRVSKTRWWLVDERKHTNESVRLVGGRLRRWRGGGGGETTENTPTSL